MAKPDPALLDAARYPYHYTAATRFADMDPNMHINNVALLALLEDARVRFHTESGFRAAKEGLGTVVVSAAVDFLAQSYYPQPLEIGVGAFGIGRSSYQLLELVRQGDTTVAFARFTMVCTQDGKSAPLPEGFVQGAGPWLVHV